MLGNKRYDRFDFFDQQLADIKLIHRQTDYVN